MAEKPKLVRITTVPISLRKLLSGQLAFMANFFDVIAISADAKELEKIGQSEKIQVFDVEMTRKITPVADMKAVIRLYRFLKKERPQIVHSHTPKAGTIGMLAAKLAGVPHRLHTVAGLPLLEATGKKRKLLDFVEKLTYGCATKVYPNSFGLRDIIIKNGYCRAEKLKVLANGSSNGIDTQHFSSGMVSHAEQLELRKSLGIKPEDFVFLFMGRLVKDKGINELAAAFAKLASEEKNIKLLLLGRYEPDLDPLKQETIDTINAHPQIIAPGYQVDVRPFFAISDVLVFPSYREGFPNTVMQAGAMDLPSIVTDINGCNEIVRHEANGIIIPPKSEAALYAAMKSILADRESRERMRAVAREMIVSRYSQQVVWDAIKSEYDNLLIKG